MSSNSKNKSSKKINSKSIIIASAAVLAIAALLVSLFPGKSDPKEEIGNETAIAQDTDIIIQTNDITETPSFYPAQIGETNLEVIAVKASDGTIRTAFNTCQVCYSSGKGYYEVEGDQLVCQNCGNRFGMDDVEVTKGGCNPVPITSEYKTVNDDTITITKDFLAEATVIFSNWK